MRQFSADDKLAFKMIVLKAMKDIKTRSGCQFSIFDANIGTESWLREEINKTDVFRDDYTTFRRDRYTRGGGVFIYVKNYIDRRELWADEGFEMIAIEVKGRDPKFTWEIVGIYRAPNEDLRVMERLAAELVIQEILQNLASLG